MEPRGMWGLQKGRPCGVLKERPNITGCILYCSLRTPLSALILTPHSATLHVGLKSGILSDIMIASK
ncbi:hypothetical protein Barb4_00161 [Bacteroidales bacterium Barb4]|nr:hypothetical protein Barb4_00161 [Bacteroidales bacterium Barb4]